MAETADDPFEAIKQKTCILKASIHCEGCKRKVKKLLNQVQGVESVDVDIKQQKVTVIGNVDVDTLVKKLVKSGKNAQVWPQKEEKKDKIHGNGKSKEKEIDSERKIDHGEAISVSENAKSPEISTKAELGAAGAPGKAAGGVQEKESKWKKSEENPTAVVEPAPAAEKEKEAVEKSNGGGTSSKKKKKKGQSDNPAAPSGVAVAPPAQRESRNQEPGPLPPANHSPPRGHHYPPPHSYYTPPPPPHQPVYAVSYNTAYPTSSYTASYYAAPPPYSNAYMHPDPPPSDPHYTPPPPYDPDLNPRQPLDSFEIFSDENPNGCFIM
ncbi:hypothetical protein ACS0TY_005638 [Phlomoides rotata]